MTTLLKITFVIIISALTFQGSSAHDRGKRVYLDEAFMSVERDWHIKVSISTPEDEWENMCMRGWNEHPSRCNDGWNVHTEYIKHDWKGIDNSFYWIKCTKHTHCVSTY